MVAAARFLHADGLGPDPHVLYLIYQLSAAPGSVRGLPDNAPDLVDGADEYQLITYEVDDTFGTTTNVWAPPRRRVQLGPHPISAWEPGEPAGAPH